MAVVIDDGEPARMGKAGDAKPAERDLAMDQHLYEEGE